MFCGSDLADENASESEVNFSDATISGMLTNITILPLQLLEIFKFFVPPRPLQSHYSHWQSHSIEGYQSTDSMFPGSPEPSHGQSLDDHLSSCRHSSGHKLQKVFFR